MECSAMEIVPINPMAECLWQFIRERIWGPFARALQGPIVMSLLRLCIWWMIVFQAFHLLKRFCEGRQRQARSRKLSQDCQSQSDSERKGVEQLCRLLRGQSPPTTAELRANGGAALETPPLVPVSVCVVDDSCGDILGDRRLLLDAASQLHAPGEEVTVLQACGGPVVQTKLTRLEPASLCFGDTINTPSTTSRKAAAVKKGKSILIQLGRWRVFRTRTGGKKPRFLESEIAGTDPVPIILHSSYSGGILSVEGLHLRGATIQAVTKKKCNTLETKDNGVIESSVDGQGLCRVEAFTSESQLPSKNLAEVFVLASKKIEVDGFNLSVYSSAIRIQNDSLRTVIQSIFPLTVLTIYATRQILSTILMIMAQTTIVAPIIASLLPCIVVVTTQVLSFRIETTIIGALRKLVVRTYHTIYFAAQCFTPNEDPRILDMHEEISTIEDQRVLKNQESSSFQSIHRISIEDLAWEWEVFDEIFNKKTKDFKLVKRERSKVDNSESSYPFAVIYKNIKDLPWASQVEVCIRSPILMEIVNAIMPGKVDQSARSKKKVTLIGPELFQIRENLRNEHTSTTNQETSKASSSEGTSGNKEKFWHLHHLLCFMDKEFKDIEPMYVAMNSSNHLLSWEMLWAFFPPRERVVYIDDVTEEKSCGDVLKTTYIQDCVTLELFFIITVTKWDYNCRTWEQYSRNLKIPKFEGEHGICNLDVHPLQYIEDTQSTIVSFLHSGSIFCELSMKERCCFRNYKGSIFIYKRMEKCRVQLLKENADGRVMIDLGSFAKMNPAYPKLGSAKPPCDVLRDNNVTTIDITQRDNRMFAPAMVYGFSFRLKKWGSFSVCGFSHINYNRSAFDDLVMDEDTKDIMKKIVRKQLEDGKDTNLLGKERLDSIVGKGEGTIILCYGPPGTGKTLTAESLSESLECPLWCLSVCELGMTPEILEATLLKVFDVATSWGTLLLLDEADMFLERRTTSNLTRNSMTGIFLRLLEYYKGVLFLTTNRDSIFDDAICSRISMKLRYERHNEDQRKIMWTKMFERVGLQDVSIEDLAEFALPDLNGREIRNIVNIAHLVSRSEDNKAILEIEHVKKTLKVYKDSCQLWTSDRNTTPQGTKEEPLEVEKYCKMEK